MTQISIEFVGGPLDGEKRTTEGESLIQWEGGAYRWTYRNGQSFMKWEPEDESVASQ
jgi:hypothetical protein